MTVPYFIRRAVSRDSEHAFMIVPMLNLEQTLYHGYKGYQMLYRTVYWMLDVFMALMEPDWN
jgi:hypothetical protein